MNDASDNPTMTPEQQALLDAAGALFAPLARLAVARGVPVAALVRSLESACVKAAHAAHPDLPEHRRVSRVSIATGLSRREVARYLQPEREAAAPPPRPSPASELFTRWLTDPTWRDGRGRPRKLPRQGPAPSFESLAHSVTRDVHPRSLLEELVRLGLVQHETETDRIVLMRQAFVPRGDALRMMGFLGSNVGDHLAAAAENVLGDGHAHFEQALYADGLPEAALHELEPLITAQWKTLRGAVVPMLQNWIDTGGDAGAAADRRVRIGLYTYTDTMADPPPQEDRE